MTILIPPKQPVVVALGMFDGVHIGHRLLLEHTKSLAESLAAWPCAYTFSNHPQSVLSGTSQSALMTSEEKVKTISALGVKAIIEPFTAETARLSAEEFIDRLATCFSVKGIVVGFNNRFGSHGNGTPELLKKIGEELDFAVEVLPPVLFAEKPVSSTRIRLALSEGRLDEANAMLGVPYSFSGRVVAHRQIGTRIGFPTANILPGDKVIPPLGVYATRVVTQSGEFAAVTNIGRRPTVAQHDEIVIESHLLDFSGNLYDQFITVDFISFLRGERRFDSLDELKAVIQADSVRAAEVLRTNR